MSYLRDNRAQRVSGVVGVGEREREGIIHYKLVVPTVTLEKRIGGNLFILFLKWNKSGILHLSLSLSVLSGLFLVVAYVSLSSWAFVLFNFYSRFFSLILHQQKNNKNRLEPQSQFFCFCFFLVTHAILTSSDFFSSLINWWNSSLVL